MTKKGTSKKYSLAEIESMVAAGQDGTRADAPEAAAEAEAFWTHAVRVRPKERKVSVHLRVDDDVLAWFKTRGKGHLSRMNAVLRTYYEAHREKQQKAK